MVRHIVYSRVFDFATFIARTPRAARPALFCGRPQLVPLVSVPYLGTMTIRLTTTAVILLACLGCTRPDPSAQFKEATQAMKDGEYRTAIDLFTQVIARQPENDSAYVNRAACHGALKETDLMLSDAEEALAVNGANVPALQLLATYWLATGDKAKARDYALRLLEVDPGDEVGSRVLGATRE